MTIFRRLLLPLSLLLPLLCACGPSHRERLQQLEALEARNSADSLMTDDSLATVLAEFFDDHGTPNERMRAHYILGRTYADRGEAPAALEAYLDAAASADTTAADCDWAKLSRVYGQMSAVLYDQNLMQDYLSASDKSISSAWLARDTIQALNGMAYKIGAYIFLEQDSLVVKAFDEVYAAISNYFGPQSAACYCTLPVKSLLKLGETDKAMHYLDIYRYESGYFDSLGNIEAGREVYYTLRGLLYTDIHLYDSAEYYFRKELFYGQDVENQSMGANGLSKLFLRMHHPDSAAKYAIYAYEMNDSATARAATEIVERTKAQYDYSRHQLKAHQEYVRAERHKEENRLLCVVIIVLAVLGVYAVRVWRKKRESAKEELSRKEEKLKVLLMDLQSHETVERELKERIASLGIIIANQQASAERYRKNEEKLHELIHAGEESIRAKDIELSVLKCHEEDWERLSHEKSEEAAKNLSVMDSLRGELAQLHEEMSLKEQQISKLNEEIARTGIARRDENERTERELKESQYYKSFKSKIAKGGSLTKSDFDRLDSMTKSLLPSFYQFLSSKRHALNTTQYRICLLLRFHLDIGQVANLLNVSPSYVSKASKEILLKFFGEQGNGLLLKKRLSEIPE